MNRPRLRLSLSQLSLVLISSLLAFSLADRTCYFPDHSVSTDVPCTSDTYTHCCTAGDICLDNGYCYSVSHQPYVLSRGSCTDQNWGADCPQLCSGSQNNIGGGCSIISLLFVDGISTYCCGNTVFDEESGNVTCPNGEKPFEMPSAKVLLGRAALANVTESNSNATNTNTTGMQADEEGAGCDNDGDKAVRTAIGAGVGVPLGVIALTALAWAFWERRGRRKALASAAAAGSVEGWGRGNGYMVPQQQQQRGMAGYPAELDESPVELMGAPKSCSSR